MSDNTDWERRWIKACRTIGELEQKNERLREALMKIAKADYEYDDDYDVPAAIARAALEAKP